MMAMRTKGWLLATAGAAVFGLTTLTADSAQAGFVEDSSQNNDNAPCSGPGTGGFDSCTVTVDGVGLTSIIAKYDEFDGSATPSEFEINADEYPSFDGSEIDFDFTEDFFKGTWEYSGVPDDPKITAFSYCGGSNCRVFVSDRGDAGEFSGEFDLTGLAGTSGEPANLSNIAFYNTGVVPLPAAAWMMIGGLGMIGGAVARNRRKARADA